MLLRGVVVVTTIQLRLAKPRLGFCVSSNPAGSVSEFTMVRISNNGLK